MAAATTYFKELNKKEKLLSESLEKVKKAIQAGQEICEHDYIRNGNDSHYDYYVCKICGHKNKV